MLRSRQRLSRRMYVLRGWKRCDRRVLSWCLGLRRGRRRHMSPRQHRRRDVRAPTRVLDGRCILPRRHELRIHWRSLLRRVYSGMLGRRRLPQWLQMRGRRAGIHPRVCARVTSHKLRCRGHLITHDRCGLPATGLDATRSVERGVILLASLRCSRRLLVSSGTQSQSCFPIIRAGEDVRETLFQSVDRFVFAQFQAQHGV